MTMLRNGALSFLSIAALAACSQPQLQQPAPPAEPVLGPMPTACARPAPATVPRLRLPATENPRVSSTPGKAMDFAQVHTVNRPLEDAGVWTELEGGWSVLSLELTSPRARTLAVRLRDSRLPQHTQIWLCSADGRQRQGPFQDANNGEVWTPAVDGNDARLEVWVPTHQRTNFGALLADAYGGYR